MDIPESAFSCPEEVVTRFRGHCCADSGHTDQMRLIIYEIKVIMVSGICSVRICRYWGEKTETSDSGQSVELGMERFGNVA